MARPRKQTYQLSQYLNNVNEGYITNDANTQRSPAWKPIVDGLAVTVLTDDYIPALILAEEESGQTHIVDGGSRTAALMMIRYGNYKIKSSVENPIVKYKYMEKDERGNICWRDSEFDIRNKTYDQFPKELQKKFDEYQIETVIHSCNFDNMAMYLRRYNVHTGANTNQKMFLYLPKFAAKIRKIIKMPFFIECSNFTDKEKDGGVLERVIAETIMCIYHFDKWNKKGKIIADYLDSNATEEEFDTLTDNLKRLENIILEDGVRELFNSTDCFIWLALFDKFLDSGLEDERFVDFLNAFVSGLKDKLVDGKTFDSAKGKKSTKDKSVVADKLHILESLMNEFLNIEHENIEELSVIDFVKENIDNSVTEEDIEQYEEVLDALTLKVDNNSRLMNKKNRTSLVGVVAYSFKNDVDIDDWFVDYFNRENFYIRNQRKNFLHMVEDLNKTA